MSLVDATNVNQPETPTPGTAGADEYTSRAQQIIFQALKAGAGPPSLANNTGIVYIIKKGTSTGTGNATDKGVIIKALVPGEAVYAALVSLHGIQSVSPGPAGSVVVKYTGDDQTVAQIVRALVASNVPVVGVEPERNELERIFMEVTKGEVQ